MKIEKISEKSVKLTVENENNKIANKLRTVFFDDGCIPVSQLDDYEEVPYEIWCNFLKDLVPQNKVEELEQEINNLKQNNSNLEEILLDTDFQLLLLDIRVEDLENTSSPILSKYGLSMVNHISIGDDKMYDLLKKRIIRNTYTSKEDMQEMLDVYYFAGRIKAEQYEELTSLLAEQPKE